MNWQLSWQLLIGVSIIGASVSVLLQRVLLKEENSHPIAFSILFQILVGSLIGLFGVFFVGFKLPSNLNLVWENLILTVLFYAPYNVFVYKSLKNLEASKLSIILSIRIVFTALASTLVLNEFLTGKQLLGAGLILFSVFLVNFKKRNVSFGKGEGLALLAAIFLGLASTNDRYILKNIELYTYVTFAFLAPPIFLSFIYPQELTHIKSFFNRKIFIKIFFVSTIFAISSIAFYSALQVGKNSTQVTTVNLTSIILTVLLSFIFLKETDNWIKKLVGALLSFIGLLLVS